MTEYQLHNQETQLTDLLTSTNVEMARLEGSQSPHDQGLLCELADIHGAIEWVIAGKPITRSTVESIVWAATICAKPKTFDLFGLIIAEEEELEDKGMEVGLTEDESRKLTIYKEALTAFRSLTYNQFESILFAARELLKGEK
jgi:hypothetical protein